MSDPSEHFVRQAQAGQREAAVALVGIHYQPIFAYLRRLSGSDPDAEDLTQQTFAKAWVALPSYQGRARFATWLHGIAHHVLADWWRRKDPLAPAPDDWWESRPAEGPSPSDNAAHHELAARLYTLVGQLDAEKRDAVHLHYFQELSLAETADALGVATSTVKYRLREALDFLRARMMSAELAATRPMKGAFA
jgi:RNA polymerase sigma-70 factor, ECF subfamily